MSQICLLFLLTILCQPHAAGTEAFMAIAPLMKNPSPDAYLARREPRAYAFTAQVF
jgi:hypothetical protein